ncbi:hypothetical protein [Salinispora pacifica]|uniref:hypothetical protein n=1 Tax=Salinispora pacifica TaxID=351187 RepID=UPI000483767B|nr:hypothetical protein [Salinispora pacifica]
MDELPDDFLPRVEQLRDPTAFVDLMQRLLARQMEMDLWDAAELDQSTLADDTPPVDSAQAAAWAALDEETQARLRAFVFGPPTVPAVVAHRHHLRLQARQTLVNDPESARQAALREYERDVNELATELAEAGLPFVEDLVPFLLRGLIRTRRARADRRWKPPAPLYP